MNDMRYVFIAVLLTWTVSAFALRCESLNFLSPSVDIWQQDSPILIPNRKENSPPVTWSFDIEFPFSSAGKLYLSDSRGLDFSSWAFNDITADDLRRADEHLSWASRHLGTGPNVSPRPPHLLNELELGTIISASHVGAPWLKQPYPLFEKKALLTANEILLGLGFIVTVKTDHLDPNRRGVSFDTLEIAHPSFETNPKRFHKTVKELYRIYPNLTTHIHMGLPATAVSKGASLAIARALENIVTLKRLVSGVRNRLRFTEGSPLAGTPDRGLVRLATSRFRRPRISHDVELRSFHDDPQSWGLLKFAAQVASRSSALSLFPQTFGSAGHEERLGNLSGALEYTAALYGQSPRTDKRRLGLQLNDFAQATAGISEIPSRVETRLKELLKRRQVIHNLLDPNFYLQ